VDRLPSAPLAALLQLSDTTTTAGVVAKAGVGANGQAAAGLGDQVQAGQDGRRQLQRFNSARGAGAGRRALLAGLTSFQPRVPAQPIHLFLDL